MSSNYLILLTLLSPIAYILTALLTWINPKINLVTIKKTCTAISVFGIIIAIISCLLVMKHTLLESNLIGLKGFGFSIRLDSLSILMFTMISLIAFIVIKFSLNYLDGDSNQVMFLGRLTATISTVQLLVLSGNLGLLLISWVLTGVFLNKLLLFYKERPGAKIAARKKFIIARLGDTILLAFIYLLYLQFGTGNIEIIFQEIKSASISGNKIKYIEIIAVLITVAALLKSAQFPTHGWLIEVMETPTPVSALLHAGLLNAGPFLIVRMSYIINASTYAPIVLIVIAGFTALYGSIVFTTQTSVKTTLAYSSIAHMGFSLLMCGLGLYPAAMLHLVAHSFYKAHAFLSSGSAIEVLRASKVNSAKRSGNPIKIFLGIILSLIVYLTFTIIWNINITDNLPLMAIGAIIVMGVSRLFTTAIDSNGGLKLIARTFILAIIVNLSFFGLESIMHNLLIDQLPTSIIINEITKNIIYLMILISATIVLIQIFSPILKDKPVYKILAIHFRNGLYINAAFDRIVRSLYAHEDVKTIESKSHKSNSVNLKKYKHQSI